MRIIGYYKYQDFEEDQVVIDFEDGKLVNYESETLSKEMFDDFFKRKLGVRGYTEKLRFQKSYLEPETLENALYVLTVIFDYEVKGDLPKWFAESFPSEKGVVY